MRQNKLTILALLAIIMGVATAGFLEDVFTWYWNIVVFNGAAGSLSGCWSTGIWGLFLHDDDGQMIDTCLGLYGGSVVTFPVVYDFGTEGEE